MKPDMAEKSNTYARELFRAGNLRVIICSGNIQWILQRRAEAKKQGAKIEWVSIAYCLTREALERLWRRDGGSDVVQFGALPEHFRFYGCNAEAPRAAR